MNIRVQYLFELVFFFFFFRCIPRRGIAGSYGLSVEKEMATHSSVLVWITPWTEESGRLQSIGLQELDLT